MNVHWRKLTDESQEKPEQKFDSAYETFLELVRVFKEASRNFILIFLLNKTG
jgi:hypothetical protein